MGGKYDGYKRILMLSTSQSQSGYSTFLLATKDYQTYILDGDPNDSSNNKWYLDQLNPNKTISVASLPSVHPTVIPPLLQGTIQTFFL